MEITTKTPEETFNMAVDLGKNSKKGSVFALYGDLGTGKTIIAKGIASGLGITEDITSPTFTLLDVHPGCIPLYHFDLYRIEYDEEFDQLCFEEYWEGDGVSVIEWAERAEHRLPENVIKIHLQYLNDSSRRIKIEYTGN